MTSLLSLLGLLAAVVGLHRLGRTHQIRERVSPRWLQQQRQAEHKGGADGVNWRWPVQRDE